MTLTDQRRWLQREQARCLRTINEPMVLGQCWRDWAAQDLAVIRALLATVHAAETAGCSTAQCALFGSAHGPA